MHIDGKKTASALLAKVKKEIESLPGKGPSLACVLVGDDPASHTYVGMKRKRCLEVGIESHIITLPESISEKELLDEIKKLNQNPEIHGILIQQPLPTQIDPQKVITAVDPKKDVDGFHPVNTGKLLTEDASGFVPCTPLGIVHLLEDNGISLAGKHIAIMGRSQIVGKPLAALLLQKGIDATVSVVHSKTKNAQAITQLADILVVAIGSPHSVKKAMLKEGCVIIDVGITRTDNGLQGDVDPSDALSVAHQITPVPGGVGPMTVAMLLFNTLKAYKAQL